MVNESREVSSTKKVLFVNQAVEERALQSWLDSNKINEIEDADGLLWHVEITHSEVPDPKNPRESIWNVKIVASATISAQELVNTETLCLNSDSRLLKMIEGQEITIKLKPSFFQSSTSEKMRTDLMDEVERVKKQLKVKSLHELKRKLVCRWIEEIKIFGNKNKLL